MLAMLWYTTALTAHYGEHSRIRIRGMHLLAMLRLTPHLPSCMGHLDAAQATQVYTSTHSL